MGTFGTWSLADPDFSLLLSDEFKQNKVYDLMKEFFINDEDINELKRLFDKEMDDGLKKDNTADLTDVSRMGMNVTYFTELFDGTENGDFVVMNLNTQNLIIALATVKPGFPVKTVRMYFTVDEAIRRTPYIKIFEYLFECLLKFFTENNLLQKRQTLGFCTELPMIQFDIDSAIISYFTTTASEFPLNFYDIQKCFEMVSLKECYKELKFDLVAVMNTNMSLMIHSSYMYGHIDAFLNLDDDCDFIYQEDVTNVPKWEPTHSRTKHIFIDTELKNFGKSGTLNFITTNIDWSAISQPLSSTQTNKDSRLLKFLSEKYIRELIRHILVSLHHDLVYCREGDVGNLYEVNGISLSSILNFINTEDVNHALQILPGGTIGIKQDDVIVAKYVCKIVFIRVALLTAICISIIFNRCRKCDFILAIKNPLLGKYVDFEMYIRKFMEILAPTKKFQIILITEDVSIEGTALGTSIIKRQRMK